MLPQKMPGMRGQKLEETLQRRSKRWFWQRIGQRSMLCLENWKRGTDMWKEWTKSSMQTWGILVNQDKNKCIHYQSMRKCYMSPYEIFIRYLPGCFEIFYCNDMFNSFYVLFLYQYSFVSCLLLIKLHQLWNFVWLPKIYWVE